MAVDKQPLFHFSGTGLPQLTVTKEHLVVIALKWASSAPETSSMIVSSSRRIKEQPSARQYCYGCNYQCVPCRSVKASLSDEDDISKPVAIYEVSSLRLFLKLCDMEVAGL